MIKIDYQSVIGNRVDTALNQQSLENDHKPALVTLVFADVLSSDAVLPCSVEAHQNFSVALVAPEAAPLTSCPPWQLRSYWRAPDFDPEWAAVRTASESIRTKRWIVKSTGSPTIQYSGNLDLDRTLSNGIPRFNHIRGFHNPLKTNYILLIIALSIGLHGYLFLNQSSKPNKDSPQIFKQRSEKTVKKSPKPTLTHEAPSLPVKPTPKKSEDKRTSEMTDQELVSMTLRGKIPGHGLEKLLSNDLDRAIRVRRIVMSQTTRSNLHESKLPYENYDWGRVSGACCENVVGYVPIPVGMAGPLVIDGKKYAIPMATTEGTLVASTSRGCKAINQGGGAVTVLTSDGMTRGPCVGFETLARAGAAKSWLESEAGQDTMRKAFDSTSRYARLQSIKVGMAGNQLFLRFKASTGDAMGMNMMSKGVEHALKVMTTAGFSDMTIVSLSGNYCTDKKASALNWIEGRGKSVAAEAIIPAEVVRTVLKTDVDSLVGLNTSKNLVGSAMAGSIGGFNAHAANIVAAVFLATGQDVAQVVEGANCITMMRNLGGSLQISVSMPSLEVGTVGGGTILEPQGAMLDALGVRGADAASPGDNARQLARIIAAAVLAGELSLCSALASGHLVNAHMQHNRSSPGS
ncbi:hypothetical protein CP532_3281 [Ophiocordyceps camponoti-leonardi (nom. inval.)]|nr:hypothetical protein CP532_3281 [Ophiocordyceps camponoti-leonardi (nom. inval.)]